MPSQPAGVRVERQHRIGVEVVAFALRRVPVRPGISGTPIRQIQSRIVRTGDPDGAAAVHPAVAWPGVVPRLPWFRNDVKLPDFFSGLGVKRRDEAANAVFAAGHTHDHLIFHDQRRDGKGVALRVFGDLRLPDRPSALRVDGHDVRVERAHEKRIAEHRQAAIHLAAAYRQVLRQHIVIHPKHASGFRVERDGVVGRLREIHDAVDDERRGLECLQRLRLKHPFQLEVLYVGGRNLLQRAVTLAHVGAGIGEPVLRFAGGLGQSIRRNLCAECYSSQRQHHGGSKRTRPTY